MNKRVFFLLVIASLIIGLSFFMILNNNVKKITGQSTSHEVAINITLTGPPELTIISPKNDTYFDNNSLLLNFTSRYQNSIKYNLDDAGNNTISSAIYLNVSEGSHSLFLFSGNGYGNTTKNVSFYVNLSKFSIHYDEFTGVNAGNSNDFNSSGYEEIQSIEDIILENSNYGKISFNEAINLTNDADISDNEINLSKGVEISDNLIEINTTLLPNLNKPATLKLYNLNFTNPRILKDGIVCSASECTEESYSGGTFTFTVSGFSSYSAEETPSTVTGLATTGAGGAKTPKESFAIDKEAISVNVKQGATKEETIIIKNDGETKLKLRLESEGLEDFIKINQEEIELNPGEEKTITIDFIAKEKIDVGVYLGKIIVYSEKKTKEVLIALEIESLSPLFDLRINIDKDHKRIKPGQDLLAEIEIFNLGEIKKVDVILESYILNLNNEKISSEIETVAVETRASFVKRIKIPENSPEGNYIFYTKVTYEEQTALASEWFEVSSKDIKNNYGQTLIWTSLVGIIIILAFIIYEVHKISKTIFKINPEMLRDNNLIKEKRR